MNTRPTLYKIERKPATGDSIAVETLEKASSDKPHLLFCGGFHSSMHGNKSQFLLQLCQKHGWGFTRFDYLGHGISDAQAQDCSLHDWLDDTVTVLDTINAKPIVIGSSMGAWLATHALINRPGKASALVTIAAAPDFTEQLLWPTLNTGQQKDIICGGCISIPTLYDGDEWRLKKALFDSGRALALLDNNDALNINIPVHMLHGTNDIDVPWEFSQQLLEKCSQSPNATLTLLRGADHRLSDKQSLAELKHVLTRLADQLD